MPTRNDSVRVFAEPSDKARPVALLPSAIGAAYPERAAADICEVIGGVAIVDVSGPLSHKGGGWWSWFLSYEELARRFHFALAESDVSSVILKFDSPGGDVAGLNETVAIMQRMKRQSRKPVYAYVDESCYSAAYALAMVADEIYLPPSAGLGSIGVITALADQTAADKKMGLRVEVIASGTKKADGHPHVALTDDVIKRTKRRVDKLASQFFELVSAGRKLPIETIKSFQAGVFLGSKAVDVGLADGVMSLSDLLTTATDMVVSTKSSPTDRSVGKERSYMSRVIAALKALTDANKALAAAKTDSERALCAARVVDLEAKYKHEKKTTTETEESDDEDSEEADDDAGSDSGSDAAEDDDDDEGDSSVSSTDASSTGAEESNDDAKTGLYTKDRLLRQVRQMTGRRSIEECMGALNALHVATKRNAKLSAKVTHLENRALNEERNALIARGLRDGRIAPSQRAWAREQSPKLLRAYLAATPKMVHTSSEEHTEARVNVTGHGAVTAEMAKIWRKQGFAEADFPKLLEKMNAPKGGV